MELNLDNYRFTRTHEWIRLEGKEGIVGITEHAQSEVTDIVFVELPTVGKRIETGKECMGIESVKSAFSIYAPVSGEITAVNTKLESDPGLPNHSPYERGWFFRVRLDTPAEIDKLMTQKEYKAFLENEQKV